MAKITSIQQTDFVVNGSYTTNAGQRKGDAVVISRELNHKETL